MAGCGMGKSGASSTVRLPRSTQCSECGAGCPLESGGQAWRELVLYSTKPQSYAMGSSGGARDRPPTFILSFNVELVL